MASVLSGWYGYNLFNIANFIEYEPYPKRRKLDKTNTYRAVEQSGCDYELTHKECSSRVPANGIYRPFTELPHGKLKKRSSEKQKPEVVHIEEEEVEEADGRVNINNLFPEILCLIFQKLDLQTKGRAAQVCSRWRDAVYLKSVWKGVTARLHLRRSNPTLFPSLVRRGIKKVQVLSLRKSLRELVNGIPNLESLNLSGCYNLSDSALDTALNRDLPNMKILNLSLCKDMTDNSLGRIATHCKNLESLDLGGCTKITNTGLLLISWGLKRIKRLNLRSCWQVSDHGIGHLTGINSQPSTGAQHLQDLCLQDCQKITDESLKHIADGLPSVERINLSFCLSVTDTGLKSLSRLPDLQELNLRSCDNVSDIGMGFLANSGVPSPLVKLDVSFCDRVTDSSMAHLASGITNLSSLSMSACTITDSGLGRICKDLAGLETLNIGQCSRITDKAVETIAGMKSLRSIDLYGCTKLTGAAFEILNKVENLKSINRGLWHQF